MMTTRDDLSQSKSKTSSFRLSKSEKERMIQHITFLVETDKPDFDQAIRCIDENNITVSKIYEIIFTALGKIEGKHRHFDMKIGHAKHPQTSDNTYIKYAEQLLEIGKKNLIDIGLILAYIDMIRFISHSRSLNIDYALKVFNEAQEYIKKIPSHILEKEKNKKIIRFATTTILQVYANNYAFHSNSAYLINIPLRLIKDSLQNSEDGGYAYSVMLEVLARYIPFTQKNKKELILIGLNILDIAISKKSYTSYATFSDISLTKRKIDFHCHGYGFAYFTLIKHFLINQKETANKERVIIYGQALHSRVIKNKYHPTKEAVLQFRKDMHNLELEVTLKEMKNNPGKCTIHVKPNRELIRQFQQDQSLSPEQRINVLIEQFFTKASTPQVSTTPEKTLYKASTPNAWHLRALQAEEERNNNTIETAVEVATEKMIEAMLEEAIQQAAIVDTSNMDQEKQPLSEDKKTLPQDAQPIHTSPSDKEVKLTVKWNLFSNPYTPSVKKPATTETPEPKKGPALIEISCNIPKAEDIISNMRQQLFSHDTIKTPQDFTLLIDLITVQNLHENIYAMLEVFELAEFHNCADITVCKNFIAILEQAQKQNPNLFISTALANAYKRAQQSLEDSKIYTPPIKILPTLDTVTIKKETAYFEKKQNKTYIKNTISSKCAQLFNHHTNKSAQDFTSVINLMATDNPLENIYTSLEIFELAESYHCADNKVCESFIAIVEQAREKDASLCISTLLANAIKRAQQSLNREESIIESGCKNSI